MFINDVTPGTVLSEDPIIERYQLSLLGTNQTFTINLASVPVNQFRNYGLVINGSLLTYVYPGNGGTVDLASGLANFLNNYGFFWATVTNSTTLTLVARVTGTNYTLLPGLNMDLSVITQTVTGTNPQPITPGTLIFYDISKDITMQSPNDHRFVTTYNNVSGITAFNLRKHCAGMVVADTSNLGFERNVNGATIKVLRNGLITYRNYGTTVNRTLPFTFNGLPATSTLPSGGLGIGLSVPIGTLDNHVLPMSFTVNGQIGTLRISL